MSPANYAAPLPLPKAAWRRRLEVFSPKLDRRLSLGSYQAWRCWIALEANPRVSAFCERPCRVAGRNSAMVDFWVGLDANPQGEFWLIDAPPETDPGTDRSRDTDRPVPPRRVHDLPVRLITSELLGSWEVPVANWSEILPYLVSFRHYRQALLEQSLVVQLGAFTCIDELLAAFSDHNRSAVLASLYWLLATGRVVSPDIARSPLSGATRFRRS